MKIPYNKPTHIFVAIVKSLDFVRIHLLVYVPTIYNSTPCINDITAD